MTKLRTKLTALLIKRKAAVANLEARIAALDAGLLKYQGAKCIQGHDGLRYVHSDSCIHCVAHVPAVLPPEKVRKPYNHGLPRAKSRSQHRPEREAAGAPSALNIGL